MTDFLMRPGKGMVSVKQCICKKGAVEFIKSTFCIQVGTKLERGMGDETPPKLENLSFYWARMIIQCISAGQFIPPCTQGWSK